MRYEGIDFGARTEQVSLRAASETEGGIIELRLDGPGGELLGDLLHPEHRRVAELVVIQSQDQASEWNQESVLGFQESCGPRRHDR